MALDVAVLTLVETRFLPAAVVVLYTVATGVRNAQVRLTSIVVGNQDTLDHFVTLHKVPAGGAPVAANIFCPGVKVPAKTMMVVPYVQGVIVLSEGQTLQGFADVASKMTITANGEKYS